MIRKYVMIISLLLVILMFTSTSTASFLFSKGEMYERLPVPLRNMFDRFSQVAYNNDDDGEYDDDDSEDDETDDGNDEEYDDGEYDDDSEDYETDDGEYDDDGTKDGLEKDGRLLKIWNMVGKITSDGGNERVVAPSNTIDLPDGDEDGASSSDGTIDLNGKEGTVANEITIDENGEDEVVNEEWTVDEGEWTMKLDRIVEIVTKLNGNLGAFLEGVIEERTVATDENGISSSGSGGGSAENNIVKDIILTDGDQ